MNLRQLRIGSFNLYNLNEPGLPIYTDADGWPQAEYDRKIDWAARQLVLACRDPAQLPPQALQLWTFLQEAAH